MHYSTDFFTNRDGYRLFEQAWLPAEPKAAVIIVHGLAEHSGRYAHVAERLVANQYAVYAYDQQGHGQSEGRRVYVDDIDVLRTDLLQFIQRVKLKRPQLPLFLLGQSMGGGVIAYTLVRDVPKVDGIILSAAALRPGSDLSPLLINIARVAGKILPKLPVSKLDSKLLSRDPAVIAAYERDPLVLHAGVPARTGAQLLRAMDVIWEHAAQIHYPLLILHGTADEITDPEGSLQLYAVAASTQKELKLYDGLYHEIMNEPEQDQVLDDIVAWLDKRVAHGAEQQESHHMRRARQQSNNAE